MGVNEDSEHHTTSNYGGTVRSRIGSKPSSVFNGFTLIELMITLSIIALLITLVTPKYFHSLDKARDEVLVHQLSAMREAIEQYASDKGYYPANLDTLVKEHYLRQIPMDPITDRYDTWVTVPATANPNGNQSTVIPGISDVHSSSTALSLSGQPYNTL